MALRYDPLKQPDPRKWLGADEWERIEAVLDHHSTEPHELPNERLHASIHVVVENQVAFADETPVAATIQRLTSTGLDRHDAIHAVGAVLSKYIWSVMRDSDESPDENWPEEYFDEVRVLTEEKWREEFGTDE